MPLASRLYRFLLVVQSREAAAAAVDIHLYSAPMITRVKTTQLDDDAADVDDIGYHSSLKGDENRAAN